MRRFEHDGLCHAPVQRWTACRTIRRYTQIVRGCRSDRRPSRAGIQTSSRKLRNHRWRARACLYDGSDKRGANSRPKLRRAPKENTMAKGQRRKSRETKKPKQVKPKVL